MINRTELLQVAENLGLPPAVVEKDYALGGCSRASVPMQSLAIIGCSKAARA